MSRRYRFRWLFSLLVVIGVLAFGSQALARGGYAGGHGWAGGHGSYGHSYDSRGYGAHGSYGWHGYYSPQYYPPVYGPSGYYYGGPSGYGYGTWGYSPGPYSYYGGGGCR